MSGEEELELRSFVTQTLQENSYLPKLRAQLRANVFLALEDEAKRNKRSFVNDKVQTCLETPTGQVMFCVVREFLEHFNLDVTISVFNAESSHGNYYKYEGQQKLRQDLGLDDLGEKCAGPILLQLIQMVQERSKKLDCNNTNESQSVEEEIQQSTEIQSSQDSCTQNDDIKSSEEELDSSNDEKKDCLDCTYIIQVPNVSSDSSLDSSQNCQNSSKLVQQNGNVDLEKSNCDKDEEENFEETNLENSINEEGKISPSEKLKPKSLLCEPLPQLNKSRSGDLLPSLYNKESKEKVTSTELDSFDLETEYEEDFMSGSEFKYSLCKSSKLEQSNHPSENTSNSISINSVGQLLEDSSYTKTKLDEMDKQTNQLNLLPNSSPSSDNY